jgi:transposase
MDVRTIGIDLGKRTFHLIGLDQHGKVVTKKCLSRSQLIVFTANLRSCLIGMEACCGAHLLGASLAAQGHMCVLSLLSSLSPLLKETRTITSMPKLSLKRYSGPQFDSYRSRL